MTEHSQWPLQIRFLTGLLVVLLGLCLFYGFLFHKIARSTLEAEAEEKALLILDHAVAIQSYIRDILRPTMFGILSEDRFILEAMSTSYATRRIMCDLNLSRHKYEYRRVAVGARNPDYEARTLELELLGRFDPAHPPKPILEYRQIDGAQHLLAVRPVVFEESCMRCHGDPADAPVEVLEKYGSERGFHRTIGEIAGLDTVTIPVHTEMAQINTATLALISVFALGTLASFGMIQAIFQRLVVHNLKRAAEKLTRQLSGQADTEILTKLDKSDQIEKIIVGIEELAGHLREARSELEEHAATLEAKVARRTEALKNEAAQRQADVALFVDMLHLLNDAQHTQEQLSRVLERLVGHFEADMAAIACIAGPGRVRVWPEETDPAALPALWREVVVEAKPLFEGGVAMVPMSPTDSGRGALCLLWRDGRILREQSQRLLCALGQQLGIALDNQEALHSHLRQKNLLQSVFDGIADPLALLDRAGAVVLSNESSRSGVDMSRLLETGPGKRAVLEKVLQDGGPTTYEIDLDARIFTVSLYPLPAASRGSDRVVAYARDITAEKKIMEGIRQHEKMATVGRLAAGLAHEINNPLGVIQCYADLLFLSAHGEREREDIEVIIRHSRQASKILSDILSFARPQQDAGMCNPINALSHMTRVFSVQASAKHVKVEVDQPEALPKIAISDSSLEQILGNLMLNALDAVAPGAGLIRVSARLDATCAAVLFEVVDNGPGVPECDQARIFDPFYTTKEVGRGTGLGLTVVYGLVSEAGGSISVDNRGGAVFSVRLPVVDEIPLEAANDAV